MKTHITTKMLSVSLLFFVLIFSGCSTTGSRSSGSTDMTKDYERISSTMSYRKLAILDLDQVNDLLKAKLNEFSSQNNTQALKEAAFIIFARPDDDGTVEKVLSNIRNPLEEENEWQNTVVSLVRQSIESLQNDKASATEQVTSGVVLENVIAELKPTFIKQYTTGGFETDIINYVAESDAIYSKAASKERGLYLMRNNSSPTQMAKKIVAAKVAYFKNQKK